MCSKHVVCFQKHDSAPRNRTPEKIAEFNFCGAKYRFLSTVVSSDFGGSLNEGIAGENSDTSERDVIRGIVKYDCGTALGRNIHVSVQQVRANRNRNENFSKSEQVFTKSYVRGFNKRV